MKRIIGIFSVVCLTALCIFTCSCSFSASAKTYSVPNNNEIQVVNYNPV